MTVRWDDVPDSPFADVDPVDKIAFVDDLEPVELRADSNLYASITAPPARTRPTAKPARPQAPWVPPAELPGVSRAWVAREWAVVALRVLIAVAICAFIGVVAWKGITSYQREIITPGPLPTSTSQQVPPTETPNDTNAAHTFSN